MKSKKTKSLDRYKVYYFTGDFWSGEGEKRDYIVISADSESDAELIFKHLYPNYNFGWVEEQ